jgi:hypothetical protein
MNENQEECMDLAGSIARLLVPFVDKLQGYNDVDVDSHFKTDLVRFKVYVSSDRLPYGEH